MSRALNILRNYDVYPLMHNHEIAQMVYLILYLSITNLHYIQYQHFTPTGFADVFVQKTPNALLDPTIENTDLITKFIKDHETLYSDTHIPCVVQSVLSDHGYPINCAFVYLCPSSYCENIDEEWDESRDVNRFLSSFVVALKPIRGCAVIIPKTVADYHVIISIVERYAFIDSHSNDCL